MSEEHSEKYPLLLRLIHWLTVLLLTLMLYWGFNLEHAGEEQLSLLRNHVITGLSVGLLTIVRLFIKGLSDLPAALSGPGFQSGIAKIVHGGLYVLLLCTPVSGYFLLTEAASLQDVFFAETSTALPQALLESTLFQLHHYLVWALIAFVVLHVLAVMKHIFIGRENLLKRMI